MVLNKNMGLALFINAYFMIICLAFCHLRYGAIDDYFMAGILSGMYGDDYNVHLPFVNAIYGYLLLPLYYLFPGISWYYIGELSAIFVSLTAISYILINKVGRGWGFALSTLLVAAYAKDLYIVLQFTQCAAVLSAAGMVVLISGFERINNGEYKRKIYVILSVGILLLWWGSLMRWDAFLMGGPLFASALVLFVRKFWKIRWQVVLSLLLVYIGAFAFHWYNQSLYQNPEYKTFVDFQPFRVLLGDGAFYNEQAVYEDLQELGQNPKDFDLLKKWVFYDNEVFAPESVQVISQLIGKHTVRPHLQSFPMMLLRSLSDLAKTPILAAWLLLSIILVVSNKRGCSYLWLSFAVVLPMLAYLLYVNRLVYRVEVGLLLYITVLSICFLKRLSCAYPKVFYAIGIVFLSVAGCTYYSHRQIFRGPNDGRDFSMENVLGTKGYEELFSFMDSQPDSVIFIVPMDTYMNMTEHRLPPYLNEPMGSWQRIIPIGFWTPYYPDVEKSFRKRGVKNPIKDLVKENVYYISDIKFGVSLVDFLEEHHYNHVKIDTVKKFEDVSVLKYSVVLDSGEAEK